MQRYFAKVEDKRVILDSGDIHHIKNVMRMKINDKIEVVCDKKIYICNIDSIDPLSVSIDKIEESNLDRKYDVTIAIGLVKEQKMDLILQKLTELGVDTIIPLNMERSIVKFDSVREKKKLARWEAICKEASEQSKRDSIPKIENVMSLKELVNLDYDLKLVGSVNNGDKMLNYYLQSDLNCAKIVVVIGPEGGISPKEEKYLNDNGFSSVSFGDLVFRVETAAIYVSSIFNYYSSMR